MNQRSGGAFWAIVLIVIGGVFLLQNLGILTRNAWGAIWPLFLILLGAWLLLGNFVRRSHIATRTQAVPLDGAREARLSLNHGAGHLTLRPTSDPTTLVSSTFDGELVSTVRRDGDRLEVRQSQERDWTFWMWPGNWGTRFDWRLSVNREIPMAVDLHTGASRVDIDLRELKVTDFKLDAGASTVDVMLPASGQVTARIKAGAATVRVHVPQGIAAHVRGVVGAGSVNVDTTRFPRRNDAYQSPDYDTAANRVELHFEGGAATFNVM